MYTSEHKIRVLYADTDQMGYVYYGNYARFYEIGRVEAIRALGVNYADLEKDHGIWMPVSSMECKYVRPARYDNMLTLETIIPKLPGNSIIFRTEIKNENNELINRGIVTLFFLDKKTNKRIPTPDFLIQKLQSYF